jgi:hypothetical protein
MRRCQRQLTPLGATACFSYPPARLKSTPYVSAASASCTHPAKNAAAPSAAAVAAAAMMLRRMSLSRALPPLYNGAVESYPFVQRLSSFAGRAVVFFFLCSLILLSLYLLGNSQDFMDETQLLLLGALRTCLVLEVLCGIYLAVFLIIRAVRERRAFVLRFILLVLSVAVCSALLVAIRFLQSWLRG